ncbi:MAG: helix-turn-helix transcriptional regulator [Thermotogae bacterium]|jgi:poly-beta-hydroxybutyrate-responsive repressor|nr:helix-turn-helix transcriptional regulator [Thermotogota bacterium]MCL5031958.1 helix-turn-helix transcriptional regulator [Thermotogota bacterium]
MIKSSKFENIGMKMNPVFTIALLLIDQKPSHGYELVDRMEEFGISVKDQTFIYRILRMLEMNGLVESKWDTSDPGPAKHVYSITEDGKKNLKNLIQELKSSVEMYQKLISIYEKNEKGGDVK